MKINRLLMIAALGSIAFACGSNESDHGDNHDAAGAAEHDAATHDEGAHDEAMEEEEMAADTPARVFFVSLEDGAEVTSPVKVEMGVEGMEVEKAGEVNEGKGHHHIVIDGAFVPKGEVVPADLTHIHFGKGQTETEVELEPGEHTLTLQFADGFHQSYGEPMSTTITVNVKAADAE